MGIGGESDVASVTYACGAPRLGKSRNSLNQGQAERIRDPAGSGEPRGARDGPRSLMYRMRYISEIHRRVRRVCGPARTPLSRVERFSVLFYLARSFQCKRGTGLVFLGHIVRARFQSAKAHERLLWPGAAVFPGQRPHRRPILGGGPGPRRRWLPRNFEPRRRWRSSMAPPPNSQLDTISHTLV